MQEATTPRRERTPNRMSYLFPIAFMANNFAMTALIIGLVLLQKPELAADIAIVQGASIALFFAFSANARSLVLNQSSPVSAGTVLLARVVLLGPLAAAALYLSTSLADVALFLAAPLIVRRAVEWLEEVHLSELERADRKDKALALTVVNSVLLILVILAAWSDESWFVLSLWLWALIPLLGGAGFLKQALQGTARSSGASWREQMLPHLGSSMIIGIAVFVFRWLLVALAGKDIAGDLFAAFAIGGFLASAFVYAIGPTLTLHEQRSGVSRFPHWLKLALYVSAAIGALLYASSLVGFEMMGKLPLFWGAVGLSLIAAPIQLNALRIKLRLVQSKGRQDTFGPDVLSNILLVACIPFLNKLAGQDALITLYLISAVLNFALYVSADRDASASMAHGRFVLMLIPFALLVPVFFMLDGTIFADPANRYDTLGDLRRLPIPISIFACYGGIVLLGHYQRARFSLALIFFFFIAMLISAIVVTEPAPWAEKPKLILLIQFVLPVFALVLGQQYFAQQPREWQRAFLYVLLIVVPVQLIATWIRGKYTLSPYLYFFSIHQHLQYVPAVFVSCYIVVLYSLWRPCRKLLLILAPIMGIYIVSSASLLSVVLLSVAVPVFAVHRWITDRDRSAVLLLALTLVGAVFYFQFGKELLNLSYRGGKSGFQSEQIITSVDDRIDIWRNYGEGITESTKTFLLGHITAPPRTQFPGAHNYYLDFVYNFGLLPLLPLLAGMAYTAALIARNWREIIKDASLMGLCGAVAFLLLPDNLLKVGMRQPYPGILTFFLWGMLLSNLLALKEKAQSPGFVAAPAVALGSTR